MIRPTNSQKDQLLCWHRKATLPLIFGHCQLLQTFKSLYLYAPQTQTTYSSVLLEGPV